MKSGLWLRHSMRASLVLATCFTGAPAWADEFSYSSTRCRSTPCTATAG